MVEVLAGLLVACLCTVFIVIFWIAWIDLEEDE